MQSLKQNKVVSTGKDRESFKPEIDLIERTRNIREAFHLKNVSLKLSTYHSFQFVSGQHDR